MTQRLARRTRGRRRHRRPVCPPREHDQRNDERHRRADRHPPRHGDDPVGVRARDDVREARGTPDGVAESRRAVVVEGGERARRQTDEEVRDRRGNDPLQGARAGLARDLGSRLPSGHPRGNPGQAARRARAACRRGRAPSRSRLPSPRARGPLVRATTKGGRRREWPARRSRRRRRRRTPRRTRPSRPSSRTRVR